MQYPQNMQFFIKYKSFQEFTTAKHMVESIERVNKHKEKIMKMDVTSIDELRNYTKPQDDIYQVMAAVFLLLGEHEECTKVSGLLQLFLFLP
jgi:5'(3')-deoxyribonucleotidase